MYVRTVSLALLFLNSSVVRVSTINELLAYYRHLGKLSRTFTKKKKHTNLTVNFDFFSIKEPT